MAGPRVEERKDEKSTIQSDAVKLDTILTEEVGQCGWYQLRLFLLAGAPLIFTAFNASEYIFTTARVNTRCRIPQCDGSTNVNPHPEFRPEWVLNAINGTSLDSFEACARFPDQLPQLHSNDTCPAAWFDGTSEIACDEYVYASTNTVVFDFQLACQEWKRSLIGCLQMAGSFIAQLATGFVSDRWGRRVALTVFTLQALWAGLACSFVNSYEWYLFLKVMTAISGGVYTTVYILVSEMVGPRYRVLAGAVMTSYFALGNVLVGLVAWHVQQWRWLTRVLYLPQVICVAYWWVFPESARWLLSKGRYAEATTLIQKVARANKTQLSAKSVEMLRSAVDNQRAQVKPIEPLLLMSVLKSPVILARCAVVPVWWITDKLVSYGMSVNTASLAGNVYMNYMCVSAVEIPGFFAAWLLVDRVGRKPLLIGGYFVCALSQLTLSLIPQDMVGLSTAMYLLGKFCISMVIVGVYVFTMELFPTQCRHRLLAFASTIGRIGSTVAPLTPALAHEVWAPLPSVMFCSFALLAGILVFTMPETLGSKLPDTMAEAEELSKRR